MRHASPARLARALLGPLVVVGVSAAVASRAPDPPAPREDRFHTDRESAVLLPLPEEADAFSFVVFGDRTGGPPEGVRVLEEAVREVNLLDPDLVMTVGDLIQGYNQAPEWMEEMREYRGVMSALRMPWFPVAGNHDVYWRGEGAPPPGEHEASYEAHFGPLWYAFRHKTAWFVALYSDEGDPETGKKAFDEPASQRMSDAQLAFLSDTLARARDAQHVFVFLHHPRWLKGGYGDDWERVHALLATAGNVTAVFAGHIHRMRYDGERDGVEYFTLATVGGGQRGDIPEAGYLHHYLVVTVRPEGIRLASLPVGSASDPRAITGEVSDVARAAADGLQLAPLTRPALSPDLGLDGVFELQVTNPVQRPLELELVPASADARWRFSPDHAHRELGPGETARLAFAARRDAGAPGAFDLPRVALRADVLFDDLRVALPARDVALRLDASALAPPGEPAEERALALDGVDDCARVDGAELDLPDGPLTLEGWCNADEFRARQGFLCKTEGSEYGIFVNGGVPSFLVHLGGRYVEVEAPRALLEPGRWHHLAGVYDGAEVRLYVDGERVAAAPASGARTTNRLPLLIGADVDGAGEATSCFPGRIDEVRLSRVARYAGERFDPARRHPPDADAALLLHLDAELGPLLLDASPAAAHAERRGAPRLAPAGR